MHNNVPQYKESNKTIRIPLSTALTPQLKPHAPRSSSASHSSKDGASFASDESAIDGFSLTVHAGGMLPPQNPTDSALRRFSPFLLPPTAFTLKSPPFNW